MSKILKSFMVIVAVAAIAIGATTAAWTDTEVVDNNVFETGTLDLTTSETTALFTISNMYPGMVPSEETVDVQNNGTVGFRYTLTTSRDAGDWLLWNSEYLKCEILADGTNVYTGTVKDVNIGPRDLAAGADETLTIRVWLDSAAPNNLQGKTATVSFDFEASQP